MTREEHLEWCKQRAREYLEAGDLVNAIASMGSDLQKHPETKISEPMLGTLVLAHSIGGLSRDSVSRFIEGFR